MWGGFLLYIFGGFLHVGSLNFKADFSPRPVLLVLGSLARGLEKFMDSDVPGSLKAKSGAGTERRGSPTVRPVWGGIRLEGGFLGL